MRRRAKFFATVTTLARHWWRSERRSRGAKPDHMYVSTYKSYTGKQVEGGRSCFHISEVVLRGSEGLDRNKKVQSGIAMHFTLRLANHSVKSKKKRNPEAVVAENRTRGPTMATLDFATKPLPLDWHSVMMLLYIIAGFTKAKVVLCMLAGQLYLTYVDKKAS
jgi:hypothetical protein